MFKVLNMENLINIACRTNIKMPETREDKLIKKWSKAGTQGEQGRGEVHHVMPIKNYGYDFSPKELFKALRKVIEAVNYVWPDHLADFQCQIL